MAKYRKICPKIWNDSKFVSMSDNGKLVFFFLLTHPHMTPLGAMRATFAGLASELGWSIKSFTDAIGEAITHGMVKANAKASCMAIPKFLKYNQPESINVVKAWVGCVDDIPECDLKDECMIEAQTQMESKSVAFGDAFAHALGNSYVMTSPIQEQEQEPKQEPEQKQDKKENAPLEKVLSRLNELREANWKWTKYNPLTSKHKTNTEHIAALLNDGCSADELIVVLEYIAAKNKDHEPSKQYFNCTTPFRPKHWENNLAMATDWDAKGRPDLKPSGNGNGKSQKDRFGTEPPVSDYANVGRKI